jgi:hypothetical protein
MKRKKTHTFRIYAKMHGSILSRVSGPGAGEAMEVTPEQQIKLMKIINEAIEQFWKEEF